ncbi:rCG40884 [Rattus norvegicus]|uniref:RCG40884 n=1 Tax=Rattus norvegicus TaxID=10116 RepID=A6KKV4_RAT|nr:rCG40884 [Rattus norvegicus]
MCIPIHTYSCN